MHNALLWCLVSVVAVGLPSQTTHIVGRGGFPQIAPALAAAAPGDIVLIQTGAYNGFTVDKGVTIRAQGTVAVEQQLGLPATIDCDIPAGQTLHIVGIELRLPMVVSSGRVTMDRCSFSAVFSIVPTETVAVSGSALHLVNCDITGASAMLPVLRASHADVTMAGGRIRSEFFGTLAGVVELDSSRFHASEAEIVNGQYAWGGPAVLARSGSEAWLSDSTLDTRGQAQCAIDAVASTVRTDRCTLLQAAGVSCFAGTPGPLLGVSQPGPLAIGSTFALDFRSEPNGFVAVFASPVLGTVDWGPLLAQPSWLDDQQSFLATVVPADATGAASVSWQIPNNPAFVDLSLWLQGVSGPVLPLQGSPVVGGVVR